MRRPGIRRYKYARSVAMLMAALVVFPVGGRADEDPFADLSPMSDTDLAKARGGFRIGAFDIALGLTIRSLVDGAPIVETHFSVESDGRLIPLLPAQLAALNNGAPMVVGSGSIKIGPDGIRIANSKDDLSASALGAQIIENTKNNVNIAHSVEMTIVMENMQNIARSGRMALRMSDIARASALMNSGN